MNEPSQPYWLTPECRVCGHGNLVPQFRIGDIAMTGYFPRPEEEVASGPLTMVLCSECLLLQLHETYRSDLMYTDTYGYRSSLNGSMVRHLQGLAAETIASCYLKPGDVVVDIGGNDGTLLKAFPDWLERWNVDPLALQFMPELADDDRQQKTGRIRFVDDFLDERAVDTIGEGRVSAVTSVAMFYDLPDPVGFARAVRRLLRPGGAWICQVQDTRQMVEDGFYDTICHEHLEYYLLRDIVRVVRAAGMEVVGFRQNESNGGSFRVEIRNHQTSPASIDTMMKEEARAVGDTFASYSKTLRAYFGRVKDHREQLGELLEGIRANGQEVFGLGASTRGNVVLQWCGLDRRTVSAIGEINPDKFGRETPGSRIPIDSEEVVLGHRPDYLLVLPWHFRSGFESMWRRKFTSGTGPRLIFPLPKVEVWPS